MSVIVPTVLCLIAYAIGLRYYARFLGKRLFELSDQRMTPAHALRDGIDYVPSKRAVVFGHHFASITGLAPMLGPAVAVIWGWVPAMLWVVLGAILVGCVHDFSALVISLRARGMSVGKVAEGVLGPRAKTLFHLVIFFGVALAMGVFVFVIGALFSVQVDAQTPGYPGAVTPSAGLMVIAVVLGFLHYRKAMPLGPLAAVAFVLSLGLIYLGHIAPTIGLAPSLWPGRSVWMIALLGYALAASILPVWLLLQARDFVNSLLLYLGLAACYVGLFLDAPTFKAPAFRGDIPGAPSIVPFVFIIVACGAASGFHGLVSSGTTAKQLDKESDAPSVGYGGMVAESLLALLAVLATTAGVSSPEVWQARYVDWHAAQALGGKVSSFISGAASFVEALGVEHSLAASFIAVVVVSFALTTLDSATRLLRYNIEEIAETLRWRWLGGRYVASIAATLVIGAFAFYEVGGQPAALALWTLFGTTNQLLAGLTLLTVTLYLKQRGRSVLYTGLPALFMLGSTMVAMTSNLVTFARGGQNLLFVVGGVLWVLALWIVVEGVRAWRSGRRETAWEVRDDPAAILSGGRHASGPGQGPGSGSGSGSGQGLTAAGGG